MMTVGGRLLAVVVVTGRLLVVKVVGGRMMAVAWRVLMVGLAQRARRPRKMRKF